jgi:hypothetical protein
MGKYVVAYELAIKTVCIPSPRHTDADIPGLVEQEQGPGTRH